VLAFLQIRVASTNPMYSNIFERVILCSWLAHS
jgi:hypothetical protein